MVDPTPAEPQLEDDLRAARAGASPALGRVLHVYDKYLLMIAHRELPGELRGKLDASDLVQETFLEARRKFGEFRGASEREWRGWLRQILVNELGAAIRQYQTGKRRRTLEISLSKADSDDAHSEPVLDEETPSHVMSATERAAAVQQALAALPESYRKVIELRHSQKLSFREIGDQIRCSDEAARKLWTRAIQQLRQALKEFGAD
ncbi:MAG: sigma-70 family RNA polymerase sigma factor [Planctomycetes bacterium]|nr:sigma-70 family RNA polymerase sigma factor [Planctomycetota bacterium]